MNKLVKLSALLLSLSILLFLSIPIIKIIVSVPSTKLLASFSNKTIMSSILLTIKISAYATVVVFFTGIPLAYMLARYEFPLKGIIESLIDVPVMIPHVAAGIALLMSFGANGSFGAIFKKIGITFLDNQFGILIAMMFVSAPYLINSAKEGFKKVDIRLEHVARTLGANPFWTFMKVTLPNAKKDIINGALMMWGRGLGEFGAIVILAYHPMTAPVLIYDRFTSFGLNYALPITAIMIIISVVIFAVIRILNNILK